jgi:hypothetical protein
MAPVIGETPAVSSNVANEKKAFKLTDLKVPILSMFLRDEFAIKIPVSCGGDLSGFLKVAQSWRAYSYVPRTGDVKRVSTPIYTGVPSAPILCGF